MAKEHYWLSHHVYACSTLGGVVLLDLRRNRYVGLSREDARALRLKIGNDLRTEDEAYLQTAADTNPINEKSMQLRALTGRLIDDGLLTSDEPIAKPFAPYRDPLNEALESLGENEDMTRVRLRHVLTFLRACIWVKAALKWMSMEDIAKSISDSHATAADASVNAAKLRELVVIFRSIRPYAFVAAGNCLFHALALVRFLSYYEVRSTWVVAVKTQPWAAHSWVQQGNLILDSNPEKVVEFTPILEV